MKYAAHSFGGNRFGSAEPLVISQLATPSAPLVLLTSRGDQLIKVLMRMLSYYELKLRTEGSGLDELQIHPVLGSRIERNATAQEHRMHARPVLVDQAEPCRFAC